MKIRCSYCSGSAVQMGRGMVKEKCLQCTGGWILDAEEIKKKINIDRRSKDYKDAIARIMKSRNGMTKEEAEKLFDDASEKL